MWNQRSSRCGDGGELLDQVDGAGVRGARDGRDRDRRQAGRPVAGDRLGDGLRVEAEAVVGRQDDERLRREAQLVECPRDREMRLVGRVDPRALERRAPRRRGQPARGGETHVADERHREEVRHHAAGRQQPEARLVVADEVAQPADDLLLDERRERPGVPDVDALLDDLGEQLADDRHRQGRRGEVAERARVVGVELVRGDAGPELVEERGGRRRVCRGRGGPAGRPEERLAQLAVPGGLAHRPDEGVVVEVVERGVPGFAAQRLERRSRALVAKADQVRLGVPVEARGAPLGVVDGHRGRIAGPPQGGLRVRNSTRIGAAASRRAVTYPSAS